MKKVIKKVYENTLFKLIQLLRRTQLRNKDFTIISNNCWGGHIYQYYGMVYNTPTVGLTFFADEYLKFISNLDKYLHTELTFIPITESRYYEYYQDKVSYYPIGKLDDIEIVFLHYKSEAEAYEKWNRRKARMNMNNLIVKFNDMNRATEDHIRKFDCMPFKNKICFVANPVEGTQNTIVFTEYSGKERIENDVTKYKKYIKITKYLNSLVEEE